MIPVYTENDDVGFKINEIIFTITNLENKHFEINDSIMLNKTEIEYLRSDVINNLTDIQNIKQYLDYIVSIINGNENKILNISEHQAYSYYTKPVKDEYGNIYDGAYQTQPDNFENTDTLLRIDKMGNVWINGQIENSSVRIGNAILELASQYTNNTSINTINDIY